MGQHGGLKSSRSEQAAVAAHSTVVQSGDMFPLGLGGHGEIRNDLQVVIRRMTRKTYILLPSPKG